MPEVGSDLPTTFGKYYLTEKLATGGMAEIYLGKLIGPGGFEKSLVIKQIHPKLSGQRRFVDLFVAEAKTLVTLAHGNIVPVYELGVIDDTYFIAMDYIDGPTLYRLTERMAAKGERMSPAIAAWIAARILDGLDYAHRKGEGVVHRDLSPRNVMLSRDGEVKIVDFGIAVALGEPGEGESTQSAPTGSFPYMSPEQVRREPLTAQSDLFTVGVLLWEMLAGERLFARPDPDATLGAVLGGAIQLPSELRAEVPARLDDLVMRALERDQTTRWPSASEFVAALNKYLYSLDDIPGPREVAALVAQFCPPETRRQPTHMERELEPDPPKGPTTKIVPKGKKPKRHQTFATHVELEEILNAGPTTKVAEPPEPEREPDPEIVEVRRPKRADRVEVATTPPDGDRKLPAPGRGFVVILGLGALVLSVSAIFIFFEKRDDVLHAGDDDAAVARDAAIAFVPLDAAPAIAVVAADAAPIAVVVRDAAPIIVRVARDASTVVDAAAVAVTAGSATLNLGASPWGEVYIDGKKQAAHAPHTFTVSAGSHEVKIVFPAETPAPSKTFSVNISAGETQSLMADFSH
ncbi:MAG TPA: serine/threonine-protein kinase [Kofleriaceae bacterium]|jgi:serine/threonine-protein kinase|nr:serine/threonine-protein kinase [Kofleriaceae bacterium]